MIIINHGRLTSEQPTCTSAQNYINDLHLKEETCTVKLRIKIPGSEFEPLVEAIIASGGEVL